MAHKYFDLEFNMKKELPDTKNGIWSNCGTYNHRFIIAENIKIKFQIIKLN